MQILHQRGHPCPLDTFLVLKVILTRYIFILGIEVELVVSGNLYAEHRATVWVLGKALNT